MLWPKQASSLDSSELVYDMFTFINEKTGKVLKIVFIVLRAVLQGMGLIESTRRKRDSNNDPRSD